LSTKAKCKKQVENSAHFRLRAKPSNEYVVHNRRRRFDILAILHLFQILNPAKTQKIPEGNSHFSSAQIFPLDSTKTQYLFRLFSQHSTADIKPNVRRRGRALVWS
jgi:hypothetical protein